MNFPNKGGKWKLYSSVRVKYGPLTTFVNHVHVVGYECLIEIYTTIINEDRSGLKKGDGMQQKGE